MDPCKRRVLRHKRTTIAELLDFSPSKEFYKTQGLLTDEMLDEIKHENTDCGQVLKWLQLLPMCGDGAFDKLVDLLVSRGFQWVASELQADVTCEKGELHIEEYVFREAGALVRRKFGSGSNLPELDKKEIQIMLANRYQAAKEAYSQQVKEWQEKLDEALDTNKETRNKLTDLTQKTHAYIRVEHDRLGDSSHDLEETLDSIANIPESKEQPKENEAAILYHAVEGIFEILSHTLCMKALNKNERKECIKILMSELGAEDDKPVFQIDSMLEEIVRKHMEHVKQIQAMTDLSDTSARLTEEKYQGLKLETDRLLAEKEEHVLKLQGDCLTKASTIADLNRMQGYLHEEIKRLNKEHEKWIKCYDQVELRHYANHYRNKYEQRYFDPITGKYRYGRNLNDEDNWDDQTRWGNQGRSASHRYVSYYNGPTIASWNGYGNKPEAVSKSLRNDYNRSLTRSEVATPAMIRSRYFARPQTASQASLQKGTGW